MARVGHLVNGSAPGIGRPTLGRVLEQLGPEILHVGVAPRGFEDEVAGLLIHDPVDPPQIEPRQLVLAVGVAPGDPAAGELVRRAAAVGAAGIVLRSAGRPSDHLQELAELAGATILTAPPELSWDTLYGYIRTVLAGHSEVAGEVEDVPLGDLFGLANGIAALVGGAVVIDDAQLRLLAFSNLDQRLDELRRSTIVSRSFPDDLKRRMYDEGQLQRLFQTDEVVRIAWPEHAPRIAVSIRAGDRPLGLIIAVEGDTPLGPAEEHLLRESAKIAALHMLRLRATEHMDAHIRGNLLRAVLAGDGSADLLAARIGIDAQGPFTVLAFEVDAARDELVLARARLRDVIVLQAATVRPETQVVTVDRVVYALVPGADAAYAERLRGLAEDIVGRAERALHVRVRAGIGSAVSRLDVVQHSRWEADRVLEVLAEGGLPRPVATFDEVRSWVMLLELREEIRRNPRLRCGTVQRLVEYDAAHGTAYVDTLRAHLEALGNVATASARLHVHPSTFRYRLRRLVELFGLDLDSPVERLAAELELHLL